MNLHVKLGIHKLEEVLQANVVEAAAACLADRREIQVITILYLLTTFSINSSGSGSPVS